MMMFLRRPGLGLISGAALLLVALEAARPQAMSGCTSTQQAADQNLVVHCGHVTIEIEHGADVKLIDRDGNGEPDAAALKSGAIYIEDQSNAGRNPFQVRTPDAIASVRGTTWAVDVGEKRSSVFVVAGGVAVRRRLDGQNVSLTAGEGVDVAPEQTPLVVKHWAPERVEALLARFGR